MPVEALHYWIVVLDVEGFSPRDNPVQGALRKAMYEVVDDAFTRAGVDPSGLVMEDRGDGVLILVPATVPPVALAGGFVRELHEGLRERSVLTSAAAAMRLRVALHQGLVTKDDHGYSGDAINTTFRLVEADALRDVLTAAASAHLVLVVSGEIHRGVVRHGYRPIDPAAYLPMPLTAKHGQRLEAWVTVPGYSAPPGLPPASPAGPTPATNPAPAPTSPASPAPAGSPVTITLSGGTVQGDVVGGNKTVHVNGPYPGTR